MEATKEYYLARVAELEAKVLELEKELVLGLEMLTRKVVELESEKAKALLRVSELEMDLDLARSKAMGKE